MASAREANEQQMVASIYVCVLKRGFILATPKSVSYFIISSLWGQKDAQQKTELAGSFSSLGRTANADRLQIRFN